MEKEKRFCKQLTKEEGKGHLGILSQYTHLGVKKQNIIIKLFDMQYICM